jgi:hypothetical protein
MMCVGDPVVYVLHRSEESGEMYDAREREGVAMT